MTRPAGVVGQLSLLKRGLHERDDSVLAVAQSGARGGSTYAQHVACLQQL